jgi:hypothetical protein
MLLTFTPGYGKLSATTGSAEEEGSNSPSNAPPKSRPEDQDAEEKKASREDVDDEDTISTSQKFMSTYGSYLDDLHTEASVYEKKGVNMDHLYNHPRVTVTETKKGGKGAKELELQSSIL